MFQISQKNVRELSATAAHKYDVRAAADLRETYPDYFAGLGAPSIAVERFVTLTRARGVEYGIVGERDTYRMNLAALTLGLNFNDDPRFSYGVAASLNRTELPPSARVVMLMDFVDWWLTTAWRGSRMADMAARLVALAEMVPSIGSRDERRTAIATILPGQWTTLNEEKLVAFLQASDSACLGFGMDRSVPAHSVLCLCLYPRCLVGT